jgi:hypothetical protein
MHFTPNSKRFHFNEHGMSSIQVVSMIAVAAVVMLSLTRIGSRGSDWMRDRTTALENEIGNLDLVDLKWEPGFHPRKENEEANSPMPPLHTLKLENTQSQIVLASGGAPTSLPWTFTMKRHGSVQASMKYLKKNNFDRESIGFFLDQEFSAITDIHLSDMTKSELNHLVENASKTTVMGLYNETIKGIAPNTLIKKMVQKIAAHGDSPATWRLAQNLTPKNWTRLMKAFNQMSEIEKNNFAKSFGSDTKTGQSRMIDGYEKLAAVTIQKGLRAKAKGKTKSAREISEILNKVSKLPLPKYVTETFSAYATILDTASVTIAKIVTSPDSPRALTKKIHDETNLRIDDALKMTRHLQRVYRNSPAKENIFSTKNLGDHPKPK